MDLKSIVEQHPECLTSRSRLAALLRDLYPDEKLTVNIILEVYESGIADKLHSMLNVDATQVQVFCHQLATDYALPTSVAVQGISEWANAYNANIDLNILPLDFNSSDIPVQDAHAFAFSNPFVHTGIITGNDIEYEVNEVAPGNVEIVKFLGFDAKEMIVPNRLNGKKVIGIGGYMTFACCRLVETVVISDGIEYIGDCAFVDCTNLKNIKMNTSMKRIGHRAFAGTQISRICFPKSLEILEEEALCNTDRFKKSMNIISYFYPGTRAITYARYGNLPFESIDKWPGYV